MLINKYPISIQTRKNVILPILADFLAEMCVMRCIFKNILNLLGLSNKAFRENASQKGFLWKKSALIFIHYLIQKCSANLEVDSPGTKPQIQFQRHDLTIVVQNCAKFGYRKKQISYTLSLQTVVQP